MSKRAILWQCPKCGHRFASRNLWHSCGNYRLAEHFKNRSPVVRQLTSTDVDKDLELLMREAYTENAPARDRTQRVLTSAGTRRPPRADALRPQVMRGREATQT
jgi:hypothetical protein